MAFGKRLSSDCLFVTKASPYKSLSSALVGPDSSLTVLTINIQNCFHSYTFAYTNRDLAMH